MRGRIVTFQIFAAALLALVLPLAAGADQGFVSPLSEVPLTSPLTVGVRAAGMGGVSMAVSDDASASITNPAALARLKRIELSGGLMHVGRNIDGTMLGSDYKSDYSGTDFTALRFGYPFPTFRGSLVFAITGERVYDFGDDRLAQYEGPIEWHEPGDGTLTGDWLNTEDYLADGGITAWSFAGAVDASENISVGAAVSYLAGDFSKDFRYDLIDNNDLSAAYTDVHTADRYSADVSGLRGTLGALLYIADGLSVGVALDTPVTLTFDGTERYTLTTSGAVDSIQSGTTYFSDEVKLPFTFRGGVAYSPVDFVVLGADMSYTDWTQMEYAGRLATVDEGDIPVRRSLYEDKLNWGVGAEITVPSWPLRLRGGYMSKPISYTGLTVDEDRSYFTLGAGILVEGVVSVDVAWMSGSYKRSDSDYGYTENVDENILMFEAAYRF